MKRLISRTLSIALAAFMLASMSVLFLCSASAAEPEEEPAEVQLQAQTNVPSIEAQVRAFAKSLYKSDSIDSASSILALHGIAGNGKTLKAGQNHSLTSAMWSSELYQYVVALVCESAITSLHQSGQTAMPHGYGSMTWKTDKHDDFRYSFYTKTASQKGVEYIDSNLIKGTEYLGALNAYDDAMIWMVGSTYFFMDIRRVQVTSTTETYHVVFTTCDRFDFHIRSNSFFRNFFSGLGGLMFREFDWEICASFDLVVPIDACSHSSSAYHWTYDPDQKALVSDKNEIYAHNPTTMHSAVNTSGTTMYYYELSETVRLYHDKPWVIEYDAKGLSRVAFTPFASALTKTMPFLLHNGASYITFLNRYYYPISETKSSSAFNYYGTMLKSLYKHSSTKAYTFRLENKLLLNGENVVLLSITEAATGKVLIDQLPMDDHLIYDKETKTYLLQNDSTNWMNGKDFYINYVGSASYGLVAKEFDLRIWENGVGGEKVDYFTTSVSKPTCAAQGYTNHACTVCGYNYNDTYTAKLPHTLGSWAQTAAPTCTSKGQEVRKCSSCSYTETRDIAMLAHTYSSKTVAPTCTEQGYTLHSCTCGASYKDSFVPPKGHTYTSAVTQPNCTEQGYTVYTCHCKYTYTDSYTPPLGHKYVSVITPNTCTEQGFTTHTCHCGAQIIDTYVPASGHNMGARYRTLAPTCTEIGYERSDCSACSYFETYEIAAMGHTHKAVVTAPTCADQGYTTHTCHCGDTYVNAYTNPTGHSMGEWYVAVAPTCMQTGTERRDCTGCDYFKTRKIAEADHVYLPVVTPPTCTKGGFTTHTCSCGDFYVDSYTSHTGHKMGAWHVTQAPTCTVAGTEQRDCTNCNHSQTRELVAVGHKYQSTVIAPTCTEKGYTIHTCVCQDSYTDNYTDAHGHSMSDWTQTQAPSCTQPGAEQRSCTACDHTEQREIGASGHSMGEWVATQAPTCMQSGTEQRICTACDHTECREIAALGHAYDAIATAPTCTEQGFTTHTCRCGDSFADNYVDAIGHSMGEWYATQAPTCTMEGVAQSDCASCTYSETQKLTALGHSYDATVIAPTCTEQGFTAHTCRCGDSFADDYVAPTGHCMSDWTEMQAPTTEHEGSEQRTCTNCGYAEFHALSAMQSEEESTEDETQDSETTEVDSDADNAEQGCFGTCSPLIMLLLPTLCLPLLTRRKKDLR